MTLSQERLTPFEISDLPFSGRDSGKVRDIYALPDDRLLLVTTDRLSAFDHVLGAAAYKGQVLNQLTAWWLRETSDIVANHMISAPDPNAMLVYQAEPFLLEVIVRGFITGVTETALWTRYSMGEREIYGQRFPDGLKKNEALPEPIITPTTKGGPSGHDERLTLKQVVADGILDEPTWAEIRSAALALFRRGQEVARRAGLILVDTKYEFGRLCDGRVALIDEVHTPDSSRFWVLDTYAACLEAGREPENYDKEFLRLEYARQGYTGDGTPPPMPPDLWQRVSSRYVELYERLTGLAFDPGRYPVEERLLENLAREGLLP
ncbi:MAG: phosphoribosylaminoimidazolesuccinocarboxamide synthase [Chloroflexi bacterium]|nr:phosphoribosylaminoimidazolesuccinocarboxamide synthase [Chloroflexota bacterium]